MAYTLEKLITEFTLHTSEYEKVTAKWNAENSENAHMQRDPEAFVLPAALLLIVTELKQLKDKYDASQPKILADVSVKESQNPQSLI